MGWRWLRWCDAGDDAGEYLQADEIRLQVPKQDGKKVQSDKWMWVTRGGPPGQVSVLFDYDPSRAGSVAVRLLHAMQRDGVKRGVVTLCIGGGQGIALALERLD